MYRLKIDSAHEAAVIGPHLSNERPREASNKLRHIRQQPGRFKYLRSWTYALGKGVVKMDFPVAGAARVVRWYKLQQHTCILLSVGRRTCSRL